VHDRTPPRLLSPWISNRCRLRATAIAAECVGPDRQPARTTARATQRCSLQQSLNDVPYGCNLAHSLGLAAECASSDLAKAYEKLDPIAVLPVHTRLVERELADSEAEVVEEFPDAIWQPNADVQRPRRRQIPPQPRRPSRGHQLRGARLSAIIGGTKGPLGAHRLNERWEVMRL